LPDARRRAASGAALVLALLLLAAPALGAFDASGYEQAIRTIKCDCGCHPQSIKDCACGRAAEMRDEVRALMTDTPERAGLSGEQVVAKYVAEFGEQIRISPPAHGFNLVAWLGPLVGLLLAAGAMVVILRRWNAGPRDEPAAAAAPAAPAASDPYAGRLARELERLE